uniref:Large ribosomal subunit protein bL35c n=1 Tax=Ishige okamurae TaxID=233772 RepID=A0A8E5XRC2_9PHAE|nr:ribosomal protein L35 [Ishige okamurae]QVJ99592.1 ribosomal protein L35 [Ishige okamurae]
MSKLKVRKAARKRYKLISNKMFLRKKAFKSHLLEKKSTKQKRNLANVIIVSKADSKAIKKMLIC